MTIALVSRENEDGSESIEIHLDEKLDLCLVSIFDDAIAANFDLHREKRFFSLTQDPDRTSCSTTEKFLDNISTNQWKPSGSTW
jgi:hypothetical protein